MKKTILLVALFISSTYLHSLAQSCNDLIWPEGEETSEPYFRILQTEFLKDDNSNTSIVIDAITDKKSIWIVLKPVLKQGLCSKIGDSIRFSFTNGKSIILQNGIENCTSMLSVQFDLSTGANATLDSITSLDLSSVTVYSNAAQVTGTLDPSHTTRFRNAIQCLRDMLSSPEAVERYHENVAYTVTEQPPVLNGMYGFIKKNLKKQKTKGTVFVSFIIEKDGSVTNIKIARGLAPENDSEAVRIVTLMGRWHPAMQGGKVVRYRYVLPIAFD